MCRLQRDLILAPLPAKKQLWEAHNETAWRTESEREPGLQTPYGLTSNGEMVKLDAGQAFCNDSVLLYQSLENAKAPSTSTAHWEEWCSGMDGFGGLVVLTASLTA